MSDRIDLGEELANYDGEYERSPGQHPTTEGMHTYGRLRDLQDRKDFNQPPLTSHMYTPPAGMFPGGGAHGGANQNPWIRRPWIAPGGAGGDATPGGSGGGGWTYPIVCPACGKADTLTFTMGSDEPEQVSCDACGLSWKLIVRSSGRPPFDSWGDATVTIHPEP